MSSEDVELARRVLRRDPDALEEFSRRIACIRRFVAARNARFGRALDDAELDDLSQEIVVVVWSKLSTFRGEASLEGWLYRVCDLQFRNALRARLRRGASSDEPEVATEADAPARALQVLEKTIAVRDSLEGLTADDAKIIRWKHYDGASFSEIARDTGTSSNTIKARYYRALSRLKSALSTRGITEESLDE